MQTERKRSSSSLRHGEETARRQLITAVQRDRGTLANFPWPVFRSSAPSRVVGSKCGAGRFTWHETHERGALSRGQGREEGANAHTTRRDSTMRTRRNAAADDIDLSAAGLVARDKHILLRLQCCEQKELL